MGVTQRGGSLAQDAELTAPPQVAAPWYVWGRRVAEGVRWADMVRLLGLALQLILCLLVVRLFQLESRTFYHVALLTVGGFVVHALLPLRYRLQFFVALSFAAIGLVFGIRDGLWLVAVGIVLISICHLRVAIAIRAVLLLVAGAVLAASRANLLPAPWSLSVWPVLGSMFMFRLALYLYGLRHGDTPPTVSRTLAYFYMLPNVCFPLFPAVDYTTFTRTYYDAEAYSIYQTGVKWIVRGLTHLLLYRLVYFHLMLSPADLVDLGDLVQHVLATFLLYLRVSGQFHLIVGILLLFGFNLPETHRLYYLASSFTDFWRRINIYWKDFMMKLVYYPSFFRLRRFGNKRALALATGTVFVATWLLHSFQWFWLRGGFPLTTEDVVFWGVLGTLVVVGTLRETQRRRSRTLGAHGWSGSLALRTVGTFCVICILWSLWSADSVSEWLGIWEVAGRADFADLLLVSGLLVAGLVVAGRAWKAPTLSQARPRAFYHRPATQTTLTLLGLLLLAQPSLTARLPSDVAGVVESLKLTTLNARDAALLHKGYYEKLDNVSRLSAQLWEVYRNRPPEWREGLAATKAYHKRNDFLLGELQPSTTLEYHGARLSINRWGMRDQDYEREKTPGTYRIALLGPSLTMGSGVADSATFDAFFEDRLNREPPGVHSKYEVLNFGVLAYSVLQQLALLEDRVFAFQPDVVVITAHPNLARGVTEHLMQVMSGEVSIPYDTLRAMVADARVETGWRGVPIPFDRLRSITRRAGIDARLPWREAERRLRLKEREIVVWALTRVVAECRRHNAVPVLLALNVVTDRRPQNPALLRTAQDAGFLVFNLLDVYDNYDRDSLRLADWDPHPNARGTRVIADRLYEELRRHEFALGLGLPDR